MSAKKSDSWRDSVSLARAILHDRAERRKWLSYAVTLPLAMLAIGLWVIDSWIWANLWRVLFWWGSCAVVTCIVILFALYDALAVIREERTKAKRDVDEC